ncbi:MAG: ABC transporter substrate-binding protein, partial [Gemmatimonadales bacterium]
LTVLAADGSVQPYLAKAVQPNGDYSEWTITTRPGVTFHDGAACDAAAVAGSLEHFINGLLGVTLRGIITKVSASGPDTVKVSLSQPWVAFPAYLAGGIGGQAGYVIAPSMIANKNGPQQPVGTGPFKFAEWSPNDHFTAVRNGAYWRNGLPYLDGITFKPIVDSQQRANALLAGNVDIMHTDLPASILQFRDDASYGYVDDTGHIVGEPDLGFVMLNLSVDPFKDVRVRQAMAMAINREQYRQVINKGLNPSADQPFVQGTPYYAADGGYPSYDPSKARSLVQAVARDTGKPVAFTLTSTTGASTIQEAQFLQSQLQAAGMQVQLGQVQQSELISAALGGSFQAVIWRQFAAVDPDLNFLFLITYEFFW